MSSPDNHLWSGRDGPDLITEILDPVLIPLGFAAGQDGVDGSRGQVIFCRGEVNGTEGGCVDLVLDIEATPNWQIRDVRYWGFPSNRWHLDLDRGAGLPDQLARLAEILPSELGGPMTPDIRTQTPDDETVVVRAVVPATPYRVYQAFTDPNELERWWWPQRFATAFALDVRNGGIFRMMATAMPEGPTMAVRGTYADVAPTRLAMSWQWDGEDDVTEVVIEFLAVDIARTEVVVTHTANRSAHIRDEHGKGWQDCLERLIART